MTSRFVSRGADKYDAYMGRWSRRLASPFLDFAGLAAGERVIEVGCGTGALTFAITARADIARVEAIDYEPQFVEAARERNTDPRITFQKGDAHQLQSKDAEFDRALSMLVLHFVSDPDRALSEMRRVVRPGGVAAATVWDNFGGQPSIRLFWDTIAAIEPSAVERRSAALIRPMTRAGELRSAFAKAGFAEVSETTLIVRMDFANFEDYWNPMLVGQGSLAEYLAKLPEATRQRIEASLRSGYLCGHADGPRSFVSVAWAVRGVVPGASK
jgi:ubiquinone/menaquinone biosynthesis C-methylase UbiE